MTITDLKVSVILSHSGQKTEKEKKSPIAKAWGKKQSLIPYARKENSRLPQEGESQWPTAGAIKSLTYRMQGKIDH